jgi:hypothetical protein
VKSEETKLRNPWNMKMKSLTGVDTVSFCKIYWNDFEWFLTAFWIWYWIYWPLFNTRLVTTINYRAITNFHTLQITRAQAKFFSACSVFTSSCLVTAYSSASGLKSSLNGRSLPTAIKSSLRLPYNSSARTTAENTVSNSTSTVALGLLPRETVCDRCLETALHAAIKSLVLVFLTR